MYLLQIILLKILNYQEDHLSIPRRAKAQVLSPVELLPGLVSNLGGLTIESYSLEPITEETLKKFVQIA